jgi:hypothetical protein
MTLAELLALGRRRPLVIQCGDKKRLGVHRVDELYLGTLWATYRAARDRRTTPIPFPTYVFSARHGIVSTSALLQPYDAVLSQRPRKANEVLPQTVVPMLIAQRATVGSSVDFVGAELYAATLEAAGFTVRRLDGRPTPHVRGGIGFMAGALKRHLAP